MSVWSEATPRRKAELGIANSKIYIRSADQSRENLASERRLRSDRPRPNLGRSAAGRPRLVGDVDDDDEEPAARLLDASHQLQRAPAKLHSPSLS